MDSAGGNEAKVADAQPRPETGLSPFPLIYVVRYKPGAAYRHDLPLLRQDLGAHEGYMRRQAEAGIIIAAGPTLDEVGGLVLISASDRHGGEVFIQQDPAVVAGIFVGEVTDWRPVLDVQSIFRRNPR